MLQLTDATGMGEYELIWAVISFIAVVGGAYAIFGGLRAVAVSDTLNGAGLLVGQFDDHDFCGFVHQPRGRTS